MKFLIMEPSPLPILMPFGPKYSPQFLNTLSLLNSLNVRDHVSQKYSNNWRYYCFIYFNFQILREKSRSLINYKYYCIWHSGKVTAYLFLDNVFGNSMILLLLQINILSWDKKKICLFLIEKFDTSIYKLVPTSVNWTPRSTAQATHQTKF